MSIHLLECAAVQRLQPSTKLVLMAFADSADTQTRIGWPGMDQVMTWSGVGRSRAKELVAELVDLGLLRHHRRGSRGRRAEYVVFPEGCCAGHPRPPVWLDDDRDPFTEPNPPIGASRPAPMSGAQAGAPAPIDSPDGAEPIAAGGAAPAPEIGAGLGPVERPPSPSPNYNPPYPPPPAGGAFPDIFDYQCPRHAVPAPGCRGCGTTPRQVAARAARAAAERQRLDQQAEARAARAAAEASRLRPEVAAAYAHQARVALGRRP